MSEVSNLLARSRAEHASYQRANRSGDKPLEATSIRSALLLREQAHNLDPDHQDDGWLDDKVPHESYMSFYDLYLAESVSH